MNAITSSSQLSVPPPPIAVQTDARPLDTNEINASHVKNETTTNAPLLNLDIDFRFRPELFEEFMDDNSQESNEKLKMILIQAQEQVENNDVDQEQIQSMVQQLIKIKNDSDARKTFKRSVVNASRQLIQNNENDEAQAAFSSGSDDDTLKQSHRVPFKRRRQDDDRLHHTNANSTSSLASNNLPKPSIGVENASVVPSVVPSVRERRQRKSKWNSPWEEPPKQPNVTMPPPLPMVVPFETHQPPINLNVPPDNENIRNMRQFSSRNITGPVWQPNVMPFNCTPVNPIPIINNATVPPMIGNPQIVMAQHGSSMGPCTAKDRTINIDGVPREIRFYGETAIAFMEANGKEPKEIGFQSGERRVCVDNNESIVLAFNDTYKPFVINGNQYSIRFGTPTRELYIDNEWYECFFGDPAVGIVLNNKLHSFRIDGPAPQVRIGNIRNDLVVGKIDMYVDTQTKVSLFLDSQVQMFQINNQMHTIQFADYFLTVIIDNIPFAVKYGAMPVKFQLANTEHYIRFSVLPNNIAPGEIYVQNMKRTELQPNLVAPLPTPAVTISSLPVSIPSLMSIVPNTEIITTNATNTQSIPSTIANVPVISESSNPPSVPMDINDLFQKLLASGIINKPNKEISPNKDKEKDKAPIVDLSKPETLKKRHPSIINSLYSGIQCSSCGIRFPLEQTIKYSQHLDWHFRENRRERDSARRAPQRKLYLPLSEWLQYQEIENEEEREKSWFETQQTEMDSANEDSNQRTASPPPSCIAGADDNNKACDMCHDPFETFYNEETEEWHLRNAVRVDENIYHPICYEDYKVNGIDKKKQFGFFSCVCFCHKISITFFIALLRFYQASLTLDESNLNATNLGDISTDDNAVDMPIKPDDETIPIGLTNTNDRIPILDDDDDVIVLPQEEPIIEEIPDDDEHQAKSETIENSSIPPGMELTSTGIAVASQDMDISTQLNNSEGLFGLLALKMLSH